MFGKVTITLHKGVWIASVATAIAVCAIIILKNGIERLINGDISPQKNNRHVRKKGLLLTVLAVIMLTGSVIAILESEDLSVFLADLVKNYKFYLQIDK
jgi:hypothetical protein